jgi:uncharacterized protein (TIGR04255 family)
MSTLETSPFTGAELAEIPLPRAPLALVVAQIRFPVIASIASAEFIAPFQEALRAEYPIMRQEQQMALAFGPQGPIQQEHGILWRLQEADAGWSVVLAPDFMAIETAHYTSRADFMARWDKAMNAVQALANPAVFERLGIRYVNRLTGDDATVNLPRLVRSEILGPLAIELPEASTADSSATQIHFKLNDLQMQVRWGRVPGGLLMAPGVQPVDESSFLLDLDVYMEGITPFDTTRITEISRTSADHAYRFFRWAVEDEFITRFGGQL